MARYDGGWGGRGYDGGYGPQPGHAGYGQGGVRPRSEPGGDWRPHQGLGGGRAGFEGDGGPWEEGPVHGPARYGLGPYHHRLRNRRRPDDELKQEVQEALFYDTWVDAEAITVEVKDGVVTLRGELPDFDEIRYATDDAWDVEGVRGVRSELRVNAGKRPPLDFAGGGKRRVSTTAREGQAAPVVD